jgi:WD40 repeat protein
VRKLASVGSWLHGVALRVASRARVDNARRRAREGRIESRPPADPLADVAWRELCTALDNELRLLPERYRAPFVLCCLEGLTKAEAATQLGVKIGTVSSRLARAREMLRARLVRRGLLPAAGSFTALLPEGTLAASVPAALASSTATIAGLFAAEEGARGAVSALADAALRGMAAAKLRCAAALLLAVCVAATGAVLLAQQGPQAVAPAPVQGAEAQPAPKPPRTDRYGDVLPPGALARLGTVRLRHESTVRTLAFSPDDRILAAACWNEVVLWEPGTGKEIQRLPISATGRRGSAFAYSPDGKALAVLRMSDGPDNLQVVGFWDPATGKELRSVQVPPGDFDLGNDRLCFSPDGKTLAVSHSGDRVQLIDTATGKLRYILGGHRASVEGMAFSPDGKTLALGTLNPSVQLWDVRTGKLRRGIEHHQEKFVRGVAFSPDGKTVASGSWDRIVLSECATGQELARFEAKMQSIHGLAFTPDGRTLVSGSQDGRVRVWDVPTGRVRRTLDGRWGTGHSLALSPSGKTVAAGLAPGIVRLWDVETGKELLTNLQGHEAALHRVAFTPDGKFLISGGDGQSRVWDAATWAQVRVLPGSARDLSLTPDGRRLATVAYTEAVRIRDVVTGRDVLTFPVPELRFAVFAGDGLAVASVECKWPDRGSTRVSRWDAATGKQLSRVRVAGILPYAFALSPDGRTAVVGSGEGVIRLCDLDAGKELLTLRGHASFVEALAYSCDGRSLASGSHDRSVRLWELATGKEVLTLSGHLRAVGAVALSPDGRLLASADGPDHGYDGDEPRRISVWDVASGRQVARFEGHNSSVAALAFSPDGTRLVSGQQNSTVLVWDVAVAARSRRGGEQLDKAGLDVLWQALAGDDARQAHRAAWALTDRPDRAVPFMKARLRPAKETQPERIRRLLVDLESPRFAVRTAATRALTEIGDEAECAVRQALAGDPALETRRRLETIEAALRAPSGEALRCVRAVAVLERIGSAAARHVLEALAAGAPRMRQTHEAQAALQRLAARTPAPR